MCSCVQFGHCSQIILTVTMTQWSTSIVNATKATCNYLVSKMEYLSAVLCVSRRDIVKAGKRLILNRSCSQASNSSAKFIFLCIILKLTSGKYVFTISSKFYNEENILY